MTSTTTIVWRTTIVALLLAAVPLGIAFYERHSRVDTDAMLDVSVSVRTISHVRIDGVGDSVWESGSGSGFLVSRQGCRVWTNHHVVGEAAMIEVYPRKWSRAAGIPAVVVASTPRSDFAILEMENCEGIPQARLGDSSRTRPGDETYAVGNPMGRNPDSITRGIISHTERYLRGTTPYLQTDAAINPGNSGGALFDRDGAVIGINTAIAASARGGGNVGVGYAVPINLIEKEAAELAAGPPSWGNAGIVDIVSPLTPDEAEIFGVPDGHAALVVTEAPSSGPSADRLFKHDVIFKIGDQGLTGPSQALRLISAREAGEAIVFHLLRNGEVTSVEVTLEEGWEAAQDREAEFFEGHLGMTLEMWDGEDGERGRFKTPVITKVQSLGPAHKAHISSSQKTVGLKGPFMVSYQLDVKTITGVVYGAVHHPVTTVADLDQLAEQAFAAKRPLLVEIEVWARPDPRDATGELKRFATVFYKVLPTRTTAAAPVAAQDDATATAPMHNAGGDRASLHPVAVRDPRPLGKT